MYSKFQSIEIKMDEQNIYRHNVRDHFNVKTPSRMFNNEASHQQYGNQCQQPSHPCHSQNQQQNWQVPQQHQLQQQQQQQQYQQQQQQLMQQQQYHPIPQHQHDGQQWQQCNNYPVPPPPTAFYMNREQQPFGTGQNQGQQDGGRDLGPQNSIYSINFQNMPMPYSSNHISQSSVGSRTHVPLPRNPQLHLPSKPCKSEVESEEAGGDRILYRNKAFKTESSVTVGVPESHKAARLREYSKEALPYLESARAQCAAADAIFKAKFDEIDAYRSDDESTTGDSKRSRPSIRTVISAKSGDDLRDMVRSQIALQQALDQTICNVTNIDAKDLQREISDATTSPQTLLPPELSDDERLTSRTRTLTTAFARGSPASPLSPRASRLSNNMPRANSSDESEIIVSLDEVVATKIISPIMRKVQRMYINNLREEMVLMEELERLPHLISEVYKTAAQQELKRNS